MTKTPTVRAKNVGPRMEYRLLVKMTAAEREVIEGTARKVRLPVSALLRKLALGFNPPSRIDQETYLELFKLRGDLGRVGGLLKLWLVDQPGTVVPDDEVRRALDQILERQGQVSDLIAEMRPMIRGDK